MSNLKCPICGGEMIGNIGSPICHYNQDCPIHDRSIPQEIYDLLERTRKALDVAKSKLNGIHRLYSKAFYTREDWLQVCMEMVDKANTALEQITAILENKNGNC